MTDNQSSGRNSLPWHLSWRTIILALLAIGTFVAISRPGVQYVTPMMGVGQGIMESNGGSRAVPPTPVGVPMKDNSTSTAPAQGMMGAGLYYPYPYPYPNPDVPSTDTREFLKVYYSATMRTRDVLGLTQRVATTVRGHGGRVDQESSSPQYGSVSFVVPQSKYDAFRTELESLVGSRFLTLNISSQNLLPQKLSIEEQKKQADTALANYQTARQKIVSAHAATVKSLQAKIDADTQQLTALRAQPPTPEVQAQIQAVANDQASLKQQLANENASYTTQLSNADANIKYAQDWQKGVQTQDQTLLDNVATVSGTVSIQWISLWEIALLYLPGYWIPTIFALLALLSYLWDRRRLATPAH